MITINAVTSAAHWRDLHAVSDSVNSRDPCWVPALYASARKQLDIGHHPFFKHAEAIPFCAYDCGRVVGRILGVVDRDAVKRMQRNVASFGFFEAFEDDAICTALFGAVEQWAKARGMQHLFGPVNPSMNYECGLLIEGFESPPTVMSTHNPPRYLSVFEGHGFKKAMDLYSYRWSLDVPLSEKVREQANCLSNCTEICVRELRLANFEEECRTILRIYNDAWEENWGFVPMQEDEFMWLADDLKSVVDPKLALVIEVEGRPAGFGLALPDVNQAIKRIGGGRLWPWKLIRFLWDVRGPGRKRTITQTRIITLGVRKEYRGLHLGPLLYAEFHKRFHEEAYRFAEWSWVLENNERMRRVIEHDLGAQRHKVHRLFEKRL